MTFCSFCRISLIFDTRLATPPKHLLSVHGDANWIQNTKCKNKLSIQPVLQFYCLPTAPPLEIEKLPFFR